MILDYRFFKLSIHQQSYDNYYERAKQDKRKMIESMEADWNRPYDKIPNEQRIGMEQHCSWPPWEFNDIVGYVDVGMDRGTRVTGNLYLMRRYLPKNRPENRSLKCGPKTIKDQIVYCCELDPHNVDLIDNSSFVKAVEAIFAQAENVVKEMCKTRRYRWVIEMLPFSLECIDFVRATSERQQKPL